VSPGARADILRAAGTVFPELGYSATTMADLARAAGVTRPTVYAYFDSKRDVFGALALAVKDDFLHLQEQTGADDPGDTAANALAAYLDATVHHLGVLTVLAHQALSDPEMRRLRAEIHDRANRRHTRWIERLAAAGLAHPVVPPAVVSEAVTGVVLRLAEQVATSPGRRDELAAHLVTLHRALAGLG
jgi:AcrR family transcriptional regulator